MISVQEAKEILKQNTNQGQGLTCHLYDALGYAIKQDVFSSIDFPSFPQSAMDGYAFRFEDYVSAQTLHVKREVQAGSAAEICLEKNEAIRIFTGAKLPANADTVVMQEHISIESNQLQILAKDIQKGANIRSIGSQNYKGECVLKAGTTITAGVAGLLAGLGISEINVTAAPKCSILTTGKELVKPAKQLHGSQIYESNSYALTIALKQLGISVYQYYIADDDLASISKAIDQALMEADILLITGGVSVGDYDFVLPALKENNVIQLFHKVKQKPGKPLYAGKKRNQTVFGLPGNPGSVLTCFYEYVWLFIKTYMGFDQATLPILRLPLLQSFTKKKGLTHFLKAKIEGHGVRLVAHQESYKMNGFAEADCFVILDEDVEFLEEGALVEVHLFKLS